MSQGRTVRLEVGDRSNSRFRRKMEMQNLILSDQTSDKSMDNYLGNDLLTEVLVRLPIKLLFRLKCVSKFWNRLISSDELQRKLRLSPGLFYRFQLPHIYHGQMHWIGHPLLPREYPDVLILTHCVWTLTYCVSWALCKPDVLGRLFKPAVFVCASMSF